MREFQFRAWDDKEMCYQVRCGGMFSGIPTAPTCWDEERAWVNLTGQPFTIVMQCIGLQDINKKNIYEADIIKFYRRDNSPDTADISVVKWFGDSPCNYPAYDLDEKFIKNHYFDGNILSEIVSSGLYHYEVIGNGFENPQLLK